MGGGGQEVCIRSWRVSEILLESLDFAQREMGTVLSQMNDRSDVNFFPKISNSNL